MDYTLMSKDSIQYLCGLIRNLANVSEGINNTNLADDKVFSNLYTKKLIDKCLEDANTEAQKLVGALTHLTCEKTTVQPTLDNSQINVIYLYSTDGNAPFQQYLKISETELIDMGETTISLTNYLTATEIARDYVKQIDFETLTTSFNDLVTSVEKKIDKDKITTVLDGTVTDEQVPSAKVVVDELNAKANDDEVVKKTDILTTNSTTATNEQVYSAFVMNNMLSRKEDVAKVVGGTIDVDTVTKNIKGWCGNLTGTTPKGLTVGWFENEYVNSTTINQKFISYTKVMYIRSMFGGTWSKWQRVCTTTVADVPLTSISLIDSTNYEIYSGSNYSYYEVINGICYVEMIIKCISPVNGNSSAPGHLSLPTPRNSFHTSLSGSSTSNDQITLYVGTDAQFFKFGTANGVYIAHFSYPVKE